MKNYVYSAANNAFFPVELRSTYDSAGTWPSDGVDVNDTMFAEFSGMAPEGKIRAAGANGLPCWVDIPPPSVDEQIAAATTEKQIRIAVANAVIEPLTDAIEFNMATDDERQRYDEWRRYRVLLTRVKTDVVPVNWPPQPAV